MSPHQVNLPPARRTRRWFWLGLLFCVLLVGLACYRLWFPTHPRFGPIHRVQATELDNKSANTPLAKYLRAHLPRRILESRIVPARYRDEARYIDFGGAQLYWSEGPRGGWIYFWGKADGGGLAMDKWEFAPSTDTNLLRVTDIPSTFYSSSHPRRSEVFGDTSSTNAFNVAVGQILFARWIADTNRVFIFRIEERDGAKALIDYCIKEW